MSQKTHFAKLMFAWMFIAAYLELIRSSHDFVALGSQNGFFHMRCRRHLATARAQPSSSGGTVIGGCHFGCLSREEVDELAAKADEEAREKGWRWASIFERKGVKQSEWIKFFQKSKGLKGKMEVVQEEKITGPMRVSKDIGGITIYRKFVSYGSTNAPDASDLPGLRKFAAISGSAYVKSKR
eukprot:TRINITY_DN5182_c0_g1_i1.p1 TRINITY_DN5182_c0_g1~~TRINITY_DN5182_c0_g1_i1.p1  ORF type:complete len:183 (+),score=29.96 TRINITY_DN5182_c0_g1_i1:54-602(+)